MIARARAPVCLLSVIWLGSATTAWASPLLELVGSGTGGGFNARVSGASSASTYFNPSLLPKAPAGVDLGWMVLTDSIQIGVDGRSSAVDVPLSAVENVRTNQPPLPTAWLQDGCSPMQGGSCVRDVTRAPRQGAGSSNNARAYQLVGFVNHLIKEWLSAGVYALVPLSSFTQANAFFVDEREQYFSNSLHPELYGDRLTPVSLAFGAGSHVAKRLYLGLSFTLDLKNSANAGAYVGNSRLLSDTLQLSTKVDVRTTVSPHLALTYEPLDDVSLSLTVHSPQSLQIGTEFGIILPNGDIQHARRTATHDYVPWIVGVGGSYNLSRNKDTVWTAASTLTYERWSQYTDRQSDRPSSAYPWRDIVTGAVGLHLRRGPWASNFDVNMRRSPVPDQTGRTNYVDNDRYGMMLGASYGVPIAKYGATFKVGAQAQVQVLPERSVHKLEPSANSKVPADQRVRDEWPDNSVNVSTGQTIAAASGLQTNNPGWPGYHSRGYITGTMLTLSLLY